MLIPQLIGVLLFFPYAMLRARPWQSGIYQLLSFAILTVCVLMFWGLPAQSLWQPLLAFSGAVSLLLLASQSKEIGKLGPWLLLFCMILFCSSLLGLNNEISLPRVLGVWCMVGTAFASCSLKFNGQLMLHSVSNWMFEVGLICAIVVSVLFFAAPSWFESRLSLSAEVVATQTSGIVIWGLASVGSIAATSLGRKRFLYLTAFLFLMLVQFATGTRGGIVTTLFTAGIVCRPGFFSTNSTQRVIVLSSIIVLCALCYSPIIDVVAGESSGGLKSFLRLDREDVLDTRRTLWEDSLNKLDGINLLGLGTGTSTYHHLDDELVANSSEAELRRIGGKRTVHSQFVEIYYENGLLGLLFFVPILILAGLGSANCIEQGIKNSEPRRLVVGFLALSNLISLVSHGGLVAPGNPLSYLSWLTIFAACQATVEDNYQLYNRLAGTGLGNSLEKVELEGTRNALFEH